MSDNNNTGNPDLDLMEDGGDTDLGKRAIRGGGIVLAVQVAQMGLSIFILAVLARMISPRDFGLVGMVTALTAFLEIFSTLGLSTATVQKYELTNRQISTLFWVNVAFGLALTLLTAYASPYIAWFYGEYELFGVTLLLSLGFVIGASGTQHRALLTRSMKFGLLGASQMAAQIVGGALGIWMAFAGYGVYALVGKTVASQITATILVWVFSRWVPGLPVRGSGVREMLKFGGYLTAFNFLNYFARNIDKVLLGRFWGAGEVGIYSRAYHLMTFPITLITMPMSRVMIPALSKLQNDHERYATAHLRAMRALALLSFPMGGLLAAMGEEIILIVYGSQWTSAVPIFQVLCIAGVFQAWGSSMGWLYTSKGNTREMFIWGSVGCPVIVLGLLPCIWYGGMGAAVGYVIVILGFIVPVGMWYAGRVNEIPIMPLVKVAAGPLATTLLTCAVVLSLKYLALQDTALVARTALMLGAAAISFIAGAWLFAHEALIEAVSIIKGFIKPVSSG